MSEEGHLQGRSNIARLLTDVLAVAGITPVTF